MTSSEKLAVIKDIINPNITKECNVFKFGGKGRIGIESFQTSKNELYDLSINTNTKSIVLNRKQIKRLNDAYPISFNPHTDMFMEMLRKPLHITI